MIELYDYQRRIVNETRQSLAHGNKGVVIISPPGSGKSVIISEIARLTVKKGGIVLFTVHRQELINQIRNSFEQAGVDMTHVILLTVMKVAHRLAILPKPSLIIVDETHHSLAKTYRKIYDYYADVPRLGFTGTLWRMNGQGFQDIYSDIVEGPSTEWLIEHHRLAPYRYFSVKLINDDKLKKSSTGDYTAKSMDDAVGKTIFGDVVRTYQEKTPGQKAILYAHDVEHSKQIAQSFNDAGIPAAHADAKTPTAERLKIMDDFKSGKIKILCGIDLYGEGVNVPDCSVSILLRPTESLALYLQQSMRSMRYQPGKVATIIDHVANYSRFGLPDDEHDWSLSDRKKKSRKSDAPSVRTCSFCYAVIPAQSNICPVCGKSRVVEREQTDIKEDNSVELEQIHGRLDMKTDYNEIRYARMDPNEAQNYEDLQGIARARHYKNGWVWYQAKSRGFIKDKAQ